jgi:putative transcriptional regulator
MKNCLKELRLGKDMTQQALADALSVSRQTVNSIETEKYDPSLPLAFKIAQLLEVRIEDIFSPR